MPRKKIIFVLPVLLIAGGFIWVMNRSEPSPPLANTRQTEQFNKQRHALDRPGSLWWIVNKTRPLPENYAPSDLTEPAIPIRPNAGADERQVSRQIVSALEQMVAVARVQGIKLMLASGYRSYSSQVSIYNRNVRTLGQVEADRVSAKPGTSEHQTGLSLDIEPASRQCEIEVCFGDTPEGQWVAAHAHEYGFIIRYPKNQEGETGYSYEPWHLRYVGPELAAELKRANQTMEQFFGL